MIPDPDRIATLNKALHFCEDLAVSGPVDAVHRVVEGPLKGRLIGIKANIRVSGQAWTAGIGARRELVASEDAAVVALLRAAGAGVLSRLLMDEGALGATSDNPHFGRCENPVWPGHSVGGSSGGSAAAVAAGAVDAALGTDTMGSVRIPAAYCGVFGLKLGTGGVAMDGIFPLAPSLDALGILARSPSDLGDVLAVLSPTPPNAPPLAGWSTLGEDALAACTPSVRQFHAACVWVLRDLLGPASTMPALDCAALRGDCFVLTEAEAVASLGAQSGLSAALTRLIDYGRGLAPQAVVKIRARLATAAQSLGDAMGRDRVILLPTVATPAFAQGQRPPTGQADFTALANIGGCPAIAVPQVGAVPPVSVQIIGPAGSESRLVALAAAMASRL